MELREWAATELGEKFVRPPEEVGLLLGWHWKPGQDEEYFRNFLHSGIGRMGRWAYPLEVAVRKMLGRGSVATPRW